MNPLARRSLASRLSIIGLATALSVGVIAPVSGCEKPRAKAERIVTAGSLIGVTIEEGNKLVGQDAIKHDEFNYYWDMGQGNGAIQVLVRGGKISRVDFVETFEPRQARPTAPTHPDANNPPAPSAADGDSTPPAPTGG